jgi:hypothetical protein
MSVVSAVQLSVNDEIGSSISSISSISNSSSFSSSYTIFTPYATIGDVFGTPTKPIRYKPIRSYKKKKFNDHHENVQYYIQIKNVYKKIVFKWKHVIMDLVYYMVQI